MKVLEFLQLTYLRLTAKSPVYFKIISNISLACALIIGMPEFLGMFEIEVPKLIETYYSKMISVAALVAAFISKLTVQNPDELTKK